MKKNVGGRDRAVRPVLRPLFLLMACRASSRLASAVATYVGLALLSTGIFQRSLLNALLGIDAYSDRETKGEQTTIDDISEEASQ